MFNWLQILEGWVFSDTLVNFVVRRKFFLELQEGVFFQFGQD
jgi:hypothetical protein